MKTYRENVPPRGRERAGQLLFINTMTESNVGLKAFTWLTGYTPPSGPEAGERD